ncbi:MAG: M28 family peptidase [bacterium]
MRLKLVLTALLLAGTAVAGSWLVRVSGPTPAENVVFAAEGWSLLRLDDAGVEARARDGAGFELLDAWNGSREYVYAYCPDEATRARAAACGRVLAEERDGLLLATDARGIGALNLLPVELCGIGPQARPPVTDPGGLVPRAVPDSLVRELVGRVSADSGESYIRRLWRFRTRFSRSDSCRQAVEWVRSRFEDWGCDSTWLEEYRAGWAPNAVGLKRGTVEPDRYYVVCAHVDATSPDTAHDTPGCEDNGSGVAAVLELARVLADIEVETSLLLVGFAGEEQGLVGSDSMARRARDRGDSIRLAVNFDMISYGREDRDSIVIYGAGNPPNSEAFVEFFRAHADTFTDLKHYATIEGTPAARSDHYSFWKYGFPAIRGGFHDRTPAYHTIGDTIGPLHYEHCGTNNLPMHAEVLKALVATVARLCGAAPRVGVAAGPGARAGVSIRPTVGRGPFRIRAAEGARLAVYDAGGRLVRAAAARGGEFAWDGTDRSGRAAAPGVYFVRVAGATGRVVIGD